MKCDVGSVNVENVNDGFGTPTLPMLARFQLFRLVREVIKLVKNYSKN